METNKNRALRIKKQLEDIHRDLFHLLRDANAASSPEADELSTAWERVADAKHAVIEFIINQKEN